MSKTCAICGKKPSSGNMRSHSMRATKRRWLPNLQRVRIKEAGTVKTVRVCTSCLKKNKVAKA